MDKLDDRFPKRLVHSWDVQRRNNLCGAPGQIGSTKHPRSVTCNACLAQMRGRTASSGTATH